MFFQIQQIALCPKDPVKAKELLTAIGAASWSDDCVNAKGQVFGINGRNAANLSFNYDMLNEARELEILNYTVGPNWMNEESRHNSVSHLGTHCSEEDLNKWRAFFAERGIKVAQEVFTESHTNPVISGKRKYHYVIFDTKEILGVDLKFIVRINISKPYRALIIDTETTGLLVPGAPLSKQPRIIELGVLVVEDGELVGTHDWLINVEQPLPEIITKITGIKTEDLAGKPLFSEIITEVLEVFHGADCAIAHNMQFDRTMVDNDYERSGFIDFPWPENMICTVQEFIPKYGRMVKLNELYERTTGKKIKQTHRAVDDCMLIYEVLKEIDYFSMLKDAAE